MIKGWIDAKITHAGIFVGRNDDGKVMFSLSINGCPTSDPSHDYSERSLLTLTLTHLGELSADEKKSLLDAGEEVKELHEMSEKAAEYDAQLQKFIDEMDVTEGGYTQYVADVTALQNKIASEKDGVKTLMSNNSYLAETTVGEEKSTVLLLTAKLYHDRAETFKTTVAAITADSDETEWDALNALYDKSAAISGITVPAIKENEVLKTAVGDEVLASYLEKRNTHETKIAEKLTADIAEAKTTFNAEENQNRNGWTAALTKIVNEFKPVYDKLPDELQKNTGYQEFVKQVYMKNINELTNAYKEITEELTNLLSKGQPTIDELLVVMKELASASVWGSRYDFWTDNSGPRALPWINNLKPTDLTEEEKEKVSALTEIHDSFMTGEKATEIATTFKEIIKQAVQELYEQIGGCRKVVDGTETWDFSKLSLGDDTEDALLEKIHGLRFLLKKVLPIADANAIFEGSDDLKKFALTDLITCEKALAEYLEDKSAPQA